MCLPVGLFSSLLSSSICLSADVSPCFSPFASDLSVTIQLMLTNITTRSKCAAWRTVTCAAPVAMTETQLDGQDRQTDMSRDRQTDQHDTKTDAQTRALRDRRTFRHATRRGTNVSRGRPHNRRCQSSHRTGTGSGAGKFWVVI